MVRIFGSIFVNWIVNQVCAAIRRVTSVVLAQIEGGLWQRRDREHHPGEKVFNSLHCRDLWRGAPQPLSVARRANSGWRRPKYWTTIRGHAKKVPGKEEHTVQETLEKKVRQICTSREEQEETITSRTYGSYVVEFWRCSVLWYNRFHKSVHPVLDWIRHEYQKETPLMVFLPETSNQTRWRPWATLSLSIRFRPCNAPFSSPSFGVACAARFWRVPWILPRLNHLHLRPTALPSPTK